MKKLVNPLVVLFVLSLCLFSCSIKDDLSLDENLDTQKTELSNQDDDPETEETGG